MAVWDGISSHLISHLKQGGARRIALVTRCHKLMRPRSSESPERSGWEKMNGADASMLAFASTMTMLRSAILPASTGAAHE